MNCLVVAWMMLGLTSLALSVLGALSTRDWGRRVRAVGVDPDLVK